MGGGEWSQTPPDAPIVQAAVSVTRALEFVDAVELTKTEELIGRRILKESGLPIVTADTLAEAAERVVAALKTTRAGRASAGNGQS